ncbi:MAG: endonuclease/exonuclease/phosphatase family protein [Pseudomonadota bacterium]
MRELWVACVLAAIAGAASANDVCTPDSLDGDLAKPPGSTRFATFNAFLNRAAPGELARDLERADDQPDGADAQIGAVAEIIQRVRPDVLLLNEFDHDAAGDGLRRLQRNFLSHGQNGAAPIVYPHVYGGASNTGVPSGLDLDRDGRTDGAGDALGYGAFPGQYGMALLSRWPLALDAVRAFREFRWRDMPGALLPDDTATQAPGDYYEPAALRALPLSSKSHWDIPVRIGDAIVHVLAAHPTPPVFDGPEDRNGRRNHDEIRLWADYVSGAADYLVDDAGAAGALGEARFVIMGDYNADPLDGDSSAGAIAQLTEHPAIDARILPGSHGASVDARGEGGANAKQRGDARLDTADLNPAGPGNLRIDYVLPSRFGLDVVCGGVFWPRPWEDTYRLVGSGYPVVSSDHRLVWLDVRVRP